MPALAVEGNSCRDGHYTAFTCDANVRVSAVATAITRRVEWARRARTDPARRAAMIEEGKPTETTGSNRPVAQVGQDPRLLAFGQDVRRHALMAGWVFQGVQTNE